LIEILQPRRVVAQEQHERPPIELQFAQSIEDASDVLIDFLHDIAIGAPRTSALELLGPKQGDVRKVVGEIDEERLVPMLTNEPDRLVGGPSRDRRLVGRARARRPASGGPAALHR
jgi:hypothetical protein